MSKVSLAAERAGFRVRDWCALTSISRASYYALPAEKQPRSITFGRRRIIVESPAAWLERVALGGANRSHCAPDREHGS